VSELDDAGGSILEEPHLSQTLGSRAASPRWWWGVNYYKVGNERGFGRQSES
jgi:hypothetical protein